MGSILEFEARGVFDDATTRIMGERSTLLAKICMTADSPSSFGKSWRDG